MENSFFKRNYLPLILFGLSQIVFGLCYFHYQRQAVDAHPQQAPLSLYLCMCIFAAGNIGYSYFIWRPLRARTNGEELTMDEEEGRFGTAVYTIMLGVLYALCHLQRQSA